MTQYKFLTPNLAAAAALAYLGLSPTGAAGFFLAYLIRFIVNLLENTGLRIINTVTIEFTTEADRKEFDEQQEIALDQSYVASLSEEERHAKSQIFRNKFRKFVSFGFLRN